MLQSLIRTFLVCALLTGLGPARASNSDEAAVRKAVSLYLHGASFNVQAEINRAFYTNARLYLDSPSGALRELSGPEYAQLFPDEKKMQFNGRVGRLVSVDVSGTVATAKAEILIPSQQARFVDVLLLKKIGAAWKIVSKSAHREAALARTVKILIVVSNADRYPGTSVNTGNNFPELAYTYEAFRNAGYTVDFVSPDGGAVPLEMINTGDVLQKRYLYDRDFMWALGHTRRASEIVADEYAGIVFSGGGASIIGVPGHEGLQNIALRIYARKGVVAAICQGTEALANLRLQDGSYLVQGRTVTSFPDAFLNKESPIFRAYPFSTEHGLIRRGAKFVHGANGKSHVAVDGSVVTGMNWESSSDVALAMIRQIEGTD